jgi:hypothetical protein
MYWQGQTPARLHYQALFCRLLFASSSNSLIKLPMALTVKVCPSVTILLLSVIVFKAYSISFSCLSNFEDLPVSRFDFSFLKIFSQC